MSYWYVASPYTNYPGGVDEAFKLICRATAKLIEAGVPVFSPIAHSHPIAEHGALDGKDPDLWHRVDKPMVDSAIGIIVVMLPGWAESRGVQAELREFRKAGKPVMFMEWRA